jgi:hypothetical protein
MKTDIHASQEAAVADLVRAGQVRIGMFPPHYIKNATTGELKGWGVDLALALAARIGVEARPVEYPSPDKLLEGLNADACDAGFLVNSPVWANAVDYSQPFLQQDFTFLLPPGSSIRSIADVDRPEVRIAVVRHHASILELARILRQAKMVSNDTLQGAADRNRAALLQPSAILLWHLMTILLTSTVVVLGPSAADNNACAGTMLPIKLFHRECRPLQPGNWRKSQRTALGRRPRAQKIDFPSRTPT